ncbi:hypothetical protein PFICI_03997 [Pestalotiopsis fici W106-1]|uniref:Uncharacterized protein n=1 Tax=Pestalotiopsis fici (strain W106-1 / CGMCC3.15140) TaxID=1229662 RepID=W3XKH8_PESFW|nr:uncharacterized protein PFICI_03997 [Pestalotiopsis fici W106-1]ETS85972.1 hypothetical protein PFICI_03997 [Pestalotiopsis fici W106-1]
MTLTDRVAVVSGSSSGIGAAIAQELSKRGARVVINYPFEAEKQRAETVQSTLARSTESIIVEADLSTTTGPTKLVEAAVAAFGTIDILVNNAGIVVPADMEDGDEERLLRAWDATVNLNGRGTLLLTHAVLQHLSKNNSRIINISSISTRDPEPFALIYGATKGMVDSFTRTWARYLPRKYGCTVNAVAPGPIGTEALLTAPLPLQDSVRETYERTPIAPRMGTVSEVAWTVAMLCEEEASWLNGQYIHVDGGLILF